MGLLEQVAGAFDIGVKAAENSVIDPEVAARHRLDPEPRERARLRPLGLPPGRRQSPAISIARRVFDYFRPEIHGIENVPGGRVLLVPNHSGQLPFDGIVIAVACLLRAHVPRLVRAQAERWVPTLPFINEAFSRAGVVVGDPINCRNLLLEENAILVFPEGTNGSGKPWADRYHLRRFGRGFMRLALQTDAPIVPVAVVGGEESIISLHNWRGLAKLIGAPYVPISPWLPHPRAASPTCRCR